METSEKLEQVKIYFSATDYEIGDQIPVDIHTDGFTKLSGLPELQLTVPLAKKYVISIFNKLMEGFLQGKELQENVKLQILPGYPPVILRVMTCCDEQKLIRVIMPDPEGHFPDRSNITPYKEQLDATPYYKRRFKKISVITLNYKE